MPPAAAISTDAESDKQKMSKFIADDAIWHYQRRKTIMDRDPTIKKYFKTFPPSMLFLLAIIVVRCYCTVTAAAWLSTCSSWVSWYFCTLAYCLIFDQWLLHCGMTFSHEHSHNLLTDNKYGIMLVDAMLDWYISSFGENLKYVYSHSRFHHPNLGDKKKDSELQNKSLPEHPWNRFLQFGMVFIPGLIIVDLTTSVKVASKVKTTREFAVPATWKTRKYVCYAASAAAIAFHIMNGSIIIQLWALGLFISPWSVWRKGQSIAEHITHFKNPAPTFTTPMWWVNLPFFNTGYHDEHHTFPMVPWIYLPTIKKKYNDIFCHEQHAPYEFLWFKWFLSGCPNYRDPELNEYTGKVWYDIKSEEGHTANKKEE